MRINMLEVDTKCQAYERKERLADRGGSWFCQTRGNFVLQRNVKSSDFLQRKCWACQIARILPEKLVIYQLLTD